VKDDFSVNSEMFLMTNFVNLNIKPIHSFGCVHRNMIYVYVFNTHTYINIYIYTMF
jgi:hypothetical protein